MNVFYTLGGTATNGNDYSSIVANVITIPAGETTVDRQISPVNDASVEGPETVIITLTDDAQYNLGAPGTETATVTIADQPTPVVTIAAFDPNASEVGLDPGLFRFTRAGDT